MIENWKNIEFNTLSKVQGGYAFKSNDYQVEGALLVRIGNLQHGRISFHNSVFINTYLNFYTDFELKEKDILIGLTGDLGKLAKVSKNDLPALLNQRVGRFIPTDETDNEFLYQLISSKYFQEKLKIFFEGGAQANISPKKIESVKLYTTTDKPEQTRIAQILSKADAAISQTEALIAKYQRIKTGLMQDLLACGIDEHGNIRSKATHRFVVKNGIEVPEEWEVDCLATLIKAVDAHPSHRTPPSVENGIPYLGISDIDEYGNIDLKKCRKVSLSVLQEHNNRYQLNDGDIIFGKIGTIGEPKRLKAWREVTISANVILIQPHNTPDFIFWVLNSDFIKTQVKNTIHSTTQPAFGMEKIRALVIPIPSKPEREQIEKILNKSEDNLISSRIRLYKLQSLKTGLMQDLLAGKVRVKINEEAHA